VGGRWRCKQHASGFEQRAAHAQQAQCACRISLYLSPCLPAGGKRHCGIAVHCVLRRQGALIFSKQKTSASRPTNTSGGMACEHKPYSWPLCSGAALLSTSIYLGRHIGVPFAARRRGMACYLRSAGRAAGANVRRGGGGCGGAAASWRRGGGRVKTARHQGMAFYGAAACVFICTPGRLASVSAPVSILLCSRIRLFIPPASPASAARRRRLRYARAVWRDGFAPGDGISSALRVGCANGAWAQRREPLVCSAN
jgi:hypothetical protein